MCINEMLKLFFKALGDVEKEEQKHLPTMAFYWAPCGYFSVPHHSASIWFNVTEVGTGIIKN